MGTIWRRASGNVKAHPSSYYCVAEHNSTSLGILHHERMHCEEGANEGETDATIDV